MSRNQEERKGPSKPVGPLSTVISLGDGDGPRNRKSGRGAGAGRKQGINPLIVLRRTAFVTQSAQQDRCEVDKDGGVRRLLHWAQQSDLGQDGSLIAAVQARRTRSLEELRDSGLTVARLHARVQWRLTAGMGAKDNAHEIGLALHGTYGWPVLPASGMKGMAAAWAACRAADPAMADTVFGTPRPTVVRPGRPAEPEAHDPTADIGRRGPQTSEAAAGTVRFLDALPLDVAPVRRDVLTPHAKPYYEKAEKNRTDEALGKKVTSALVPPAEHHNPVPVTFLTVEGAVFGVDLFGRDATHVEHAVRWFVGAADELGAGAKTSAGYGYLDVTPDPNWPQPTYSTTKADT
ncbi:type III-B CRISPR module RAMP protein Cmr6 [Streptomyces sp. NPDC003393]